jgi:transcriptional regulator with XRE-family HTH domain
MSNRNKSAIAKPSTTYPEIVGQVLQKYRKNKNLDQAALAAKVGITNSALSRIERGGSSVSLDQLAKLSRALGEMPSVIISDADKVSEALKHAGVEVSEEKPGRGKTLVTAIALAALAIWVAKAIK